MRKALVVPLLPLLAMGVACDRKGFVGEAHLASSASQTLSPPPYPMDPTHIPDRSGWKPLGDIRPSFAGPHRGSFQRVTLNPIAAAALDRGAFNPWPEGAQVVKEALDKNGKRLGYFWMSKEQGQWIWATGDLSGRVEARFPGESSGACAACHGTRAARFDGCFSPVFAGKGTLDIPLNSSAPLR